MKCPECQEQGLKSTIREGGSMSTLMYCAPFYDEEGVRHHHDCNTTTTSYECSNGHRWGEKMKKTCPAPDCNWGNE